MKEGQGKGDSSRNPLEVLVNKITKKPQKGESKDKDTNEKPKKDKLTRRK